MHEASYPPRPTPFEGTSFPVSSPGSTGSDGAHVEEPAGLQGSPLGDSNPGPLPYHGAPQTAEYRPVAAETPDSEGDSESADERERVPGSSPTVPQAKRQPTQRAPRKARGKCECEFCFYCEMPLAGSETHDHDHFPLPHSAHGGLTVPACKNCHSLKDRVSMAEWPIATFFAALGGLNTEGRLMMAQFFHVTSRAVARDIHVKSMCDALDAVLAAENLAEAQEHATEALRWFRASVRQTHFPNALESARELVESRQALAEQHARDLGHEAA
jgi:hypothetical protein